MKKVRKDGHFEAIETPDREYGLWALHALEDATKLAKKFDYAADFTKLDVAGRQKWNRDRHDLERDVTTAILFSALAVEAFLNLYGVVRLGTTYYHDNVERMRPTEKVSAIVLAISGNKLLEKGDRLVQVTHEIFAARNEIAHPKAAELTWARATEKIHQAIPKPEDGGLPKAKNSVSWMVTFFREFKKLTPESAVWMNPRVLAGKSR